MTYNTLNIETLKTKVNYTFFKEKNKPGELHAIVEILDNTLIAKEQYSNIDQSVEQLLKISSFQNVSLVWKRYFVSDAVNQSSLIKRMGQEAVSIVQQPPLRGSKVALWLYAVEEVTLANPSDRITLMKRPNYSHLFHTQLHSSEGDSFQQAQAIFSEYVQDLSAWKATLEGNCLRTWLFVQNVDIQYQAMVEARKQLFEKENLTKQTHFIASTGIEGKYTDPRVINLMDAYAIPEIKKEQITYLKGSSHLNPTHEYGVTFERGTVVQYGDRRHVFISGTASINNKGEIVYPLDITKQTGRVLENIEVLLAEADCDFTHIAHLIIYLRDTADYDFVEKFMEKHYPEIPKVITLAPVCRPGWLIEIECMAIRGIKDERFDCF